jgi:GNAT superfamily N-acetyltransferase
VIRACRSDESAAILDVINDGAQAYRGAIPDDCWQDPYMPAAELAAERAAGVSFHGFYADTGLRGVMGLQDVADVALIRHAYTRTADQGRGIGTALLAHLAARTERPLLLGTWRAATWAIEFYRRRGFSPVADTCIADLLRRYWTVPERQIATSIVLADARWFAREPGAAG